jgi:subfamily B ATP-binding cassette protein MsbA
MVPGRAVRALKRALLSRFLVDWVRPRWLALIGALGLTGCLAAATASYPWILKSSFDLLLKEGKADALLIVLGAIVGATLLRSLFLYLQTIATNRIVTELVTDIQKRIFARLVDADFARLTRESPGELVSRITNDVVYVQAAALAALNTAIRDALIIAGLIITMIVLDPIMSLIVLGVYPIAALPIALISERLRRVARRTQHELGDMTSRLTEKLSSARLVKTFRLERHVTAELERSFSDVQRLRMKAVRSRARLDPMLEALGGLAVAGVVGLAYWRISGGIATVGDFMGFVSALLLAAQPIRGIGNLAARLNEGLAALERVYDVLDEVPVVADRPGAAALAVARGEISFEHVSFAYAAPARPAAAAPDNLPARVAHAVVDLSLTVPGGQTVALVGRSGSGKSTVVNLVPRLFDVTAGAIRIDGQDVRDVTLASLRGAIAIVSQEVTLFDDTIAANIRLGRLEASEAEVEAAARAAAAHEFILEQPQGYQTVIGSSGARLSGGQRQRIALARAILKNAPILLLDEATSALDSESERLVQEALAAFTRGRTTLVVAHRLATVRSADLICVMEAGRLVDQGQHEALLTRGGIYAELCRGQLMDGEDPAGSPRP